MTLVLVLITSWMLVAALVVGLCAAARLGDRHDVRVARQDAQ
jgi:hypothetical protein